MRILRWALCILLLGGGAILPKPPPANAQGVVTPGPVSGRNQNAVEQILPADVLARTKLTFTVVNLIRLELGKPKSSRNRFVVTNAAPREVYFQALTLFRKAIRLSFEITGSLELEPQAPPAHEIKPGHVWRVVDGALRQILLVKRKLQIPESEEETRQAETTTPSEVFVAINELNQQLNIMLDQRFSPNDVYQQVTLAVNYAAALLSAFPDTTRIPPEPDFLRRKRPTDVYERLLSIFAHLETVIRDSRIQMLNLDVGAIRARAVPSDVYDIASLIVSEFAYLHSRLKAPPEAAQSFNPGFTTPSHVFQRAGLLVRQLELLKQRVRQNPDWLER